MLSKKITIILFIGLFYSAISYCQNLCTSDSLHQYLISTDSVYKKELQQFETYAKNIYTSQYLQKSPGYLIKTIPVVFHIIHDNGPENIPDSLIYEQIDILNESFRKLPGTPGDGAGVDTEIQFCLATIDPNGNPTTGITRTQSLCTVPQPGCNHGGAVIEWGQYSGDSTRRYMNIWIRKAILNGGLGAGQSWGVELKYTVVGRNSAYNGRVAVHEAGHFLNLMHTFTGGCGTSDCLTGDGVCDTPPVAFPNSGCGMVNSCTNDVPDLPDQVENYMDYSLNCANMFTEGQKVRMQKLLNYIFNDPNLNNNSFRYLTSYQNLQNTGCDPCPSSCIPVADFSVDNVLVDINGDSVYFTDRSYNIPTSWQWFFTGGNPSADTSENPAITYDSIGTYDVTLIATNAAGSDTMIKSIYITAITQTWSNLGSGTESDGEGGTVHTLAIFQNELYAGGYFGIAGGDSARRVAKWDGANWYALGAEIEDTGSNIAAVWDLAVYNNELYVGGGFTSAGGVSAHNIAKWNGSTWSAVGSGLTPNNGGLGVYDMVVLNNELYVTISYIQGSTWIDEIMKWDGANWSQVATPNDFVPVLAVYNNELYAGGDFDTINGISAKHIARFDGTNWYPLGAGVDGTFFPQVYGLIEYDSLLFVGGIFNTAGGTSADKVAIWDGTNWYAAGSGDGMYDFAIWNNELYGTYTPGIAKWNGTSWAPLATTDGWVLDLTVWNNELYAGGNFTIAGVDTVNNIAKWGCDNLTVSFTQNKDTIDLAVSGNVIFTDQSVNATNWFWDFGDGATDTVQNPLHNYWQEGIYIVRLTTTNDTCSNSIISTIVVIWNCFPLSIDYLQSTDTVNLAVADSVQFTTQIGSFSLVSAADSIEWDFGDGTTDTARNPLHTYDSVGIYTVTLTGFSDTCSTAATSTVVVILDCSVFTANFTQSKDTIDLALLETVQFTDSSSNASQWNWNFGDGNTDTIANPNHIYDTTGTYTITLIVSNTVCSDTVYNNITVINTTGIQINDLQDNLKIYPNPNTGQFTLEMQITETQDMHIEITNVIGQVVYSKNLTRFKGTYYGQINLQRNAKGVYQLQVKTNRGVINKKIVLK